MLTLSLAYIADWFLRAALWSTQWFRSNLPPEPTPPAAEVVHRAYEWEDTLWCGECSRRTVHTFIEWLPDLTTTDMCKGCGIEVIYDIKEPWS